MRYLHLFSIIFIFLISNIWANEPLDDAVDLNTESQPTKISLDQHPISEKDQGWEFFVLPVLWVTGVHGEVAINGNDVGINITVGDLIEALDDILFDELYGIAGRFEARKNNFSFMFEGDYIVFFEEIDRNLVDIEVEYETTIAQFALGYRFLHTNIGGEDNPKNLDMEFLAGARYYRIDLDIDINALSLDKTQEWVDPFVGTRMQLELFKGLTLDTKATIGGFSVGSDLSWGFTALLNFRPTRHISIVAGYAQVDIDYDDNGKDFQFDVIISGPLLGVGIMF